MWKNPDMNLKNTYVWGELMSMGVEYVSRSIEVRRERAENFCDKTISVAMVLLAYVFLFYSANFALIFRDLLQPA